jgi:hypothetical protein
MPDGVLWGLCKLQESFTSFPNRGEAFFAFRFYPVWEGQFCAVFKRKLEKKYKKIPQRQCL